MCDAWSPKHQSWSFQSQLLCVPYIQTALCGSKLTQQGKLNSLSQHPHHCQYMASKIPYLLPSFCLQLLIERVHSSAYMTCHVCTLVGHMPAPQRQFYCYRGSVGANGGRPGLQVTRSRSLPWPFEIRESETGMSRTCSIDGEA